MAGLGQPSQAEALRPVIGKLRNLGLESEAGLESLLKFIKLRGPIGRGEEILGAGGSPGHSTVLLDGVAGLYERLEDGGRQIHAFQYPGDFCDLQRHVLPASNGAIAVAALADCSIGIIQHKDLDQAIERYPKLALALWRATMLEESIARERLLNAGRQSALEHVGHLLCEQLHRRKAIGIDSTMVPLAEIDLAEAAGLSVVNLNRVLQELRRLGALSEKGGVIEIVNWERLADIAKFDGRYLNMPATLSGWEIESE